MTAREAVCGPSTPQSAVAKTGLRLNGSLGSVRSFPRSLGASVNCCFNFVCLASRRVLGSHYSSKSAPILCCLVISHLGSNPEPPSCSVSASVPDSLGLSTLDPFGCILKPSCLAYLSVVCTYRISHTDLKISEIFSYLKITSARFSRSAFSA